MNVCPRDPNTFRAMQVHATPKLPLIACKGAEAQIPQIWILLSTQLIQSKPCKISLWEKINHLVPYSIPKNPACKMNIFIPLPVVLISCLAANQLLSSVLWHVGPRLARLSWEASLETHLGLACRALPSAILWLLLQPAFPANLFVLIRGDEILRSSRCNFVPFGDFPV